MDREMLIKGLGYAQKRRKLILLITALGFSTYGAYRVCRSPSVIEKRDRVLKVLGAIASITEFLGDSAETMGVISKDLKEFIQSDSDQIPGSLRQVIKILRSDELSESIVRVTRSLTVGVLRGYRVEAGKVDSGISFPDRALQKLFSPAGSGFASVVVGSFARNMVLAIYADSPGTRGSLVNGSKNSDGSVQGWIDVISDDKCRKLIGDCIQQFVSTMVTVYLDKTKDINPFDEILSSLTNPKHEAKVRDLLALVCNGAIDTFIRTSYQVLTNSASNGSSDSNATSSSYLLRRGSSTISKVLDGQEHILSKLNVIKHPSNRWASKMSSTLAVPNNMRFVLDVTGRVTVVTVKSFLQYSFNRLSEGMKRAYWYLTAKSLILITICISLYLHVLSRPWSLVSA